MHVVLRLNIHFLLIEIIQELEIREFLGFRHGNICPGFFEKHLLVSNEIWRRKVYIPLRIERSLHLMQN